MTKLLRFFRPSHQHTAFSATLLLISAVMLSRVIGYARDAYIACAYGAGGQTDAYVAAFTLPDFLNYIVAGGRGFHHVHFDLHALSGGEARRGCAENVLHHHHRDDGGDDRGDDWDGDFRSPVCALVREGIFAGQDRTVRSPDADSAAGADLLLCRWSGLGGVAFAPAVSVPGVWAADLQRVHHSWAGWSEDGISESRPWPMGHWSEALPDRFWRA